MEKIAFWLGKCNQRMIELWREGRLLDSVIVYPDGGEIVVAFRVGEFELTGYTEVFFSQYQDWDSGCKEKFRYCVLGCNQWLTDFLEKAHLRLCPTGWTEYQLVVAFTGKDYLPLWDMADIAVSEDPNGEGEQRRTLIVKDDAHIALMENYDPYNDIYTKMTPDSKPGWRRMVGRRTLTPLHFAQVFSGRLVRILIQPSPSENCEEYEIRHSPHSSV
ncbi:MAG TPA: hypothetical protein VJL27_01465 [Patescibacteria group bacterium]|nr:hypothetical protein [Patescibacteria group bacterium]